MRSAYAWLAAIFALPAACTLAPTGLGGDLVGLDAGADASADGPALDAARDSALVPPTPLANGQNGPLALALDGSDVYWVNFGSTTASPPYSDGSVMRAAKDGSAISSLFTQGDAPYRGPASIAVQGGVVVWTCAKGGAVVRSDVSGAGAKPIVSGQLGPTSIVFEASPGIVFWTNVADAVQSVMRQALVSGTAMPIAGDPKGAYALAIDETHVYWSDVMDNAVKRTKRDGTCEVTTCPTIVVEARGGASATLSLALDETSVYSTHADDGRVTAIDKKTFEARLLATEPHALAVAVDAASVYFVTYEAEGRVWRAAKNGTKTELLAVGQSWPYAIAVDADAVYWVNRGSLTNEATDAHDAKDGQVMRLPK